MIQVIFTSICSVNIARDFLKKNNIGDIGLSLEIKGQVGTSSCWGQSLKGRDEKSFITMSLSSKWLTCASTIGSSPAGL